MDTNTIILILAGLVGVGLIYRSVSNKPKKTTGGVTRPSTPSQSELLSLTKSQLVEKATGLGLTVPSSYTKPKIVQMIIIELNDRTSTN